MMTRLAKLLLLAGIAFYYTLVVVNNLTDFNSNYEFIRHVLSMDSTFAGNHAMWRAMPWPAMHLIFYWMIIVWEFATGHACVVGAYLSRAGVSRAGDCFQRRETRGRGSADAFAADVARGFSGCRRRVVSDVAVAYLERPGRGIPHVRGCGVRAVVAAAAGHGHAGIEPQAPTNAARRAF